LHGSNNYTDFLATKLNLHKNHSSVFSHNFNKLSTISLKLDYYIKLNSLFEKIRSPEYSQKKLSAPWKVKYDDISYSDYYHVFKQQRRVKKKKESENRYLGESAWWK
jgi:cell division septal protein FtsQ